MSSSLMRCLISTLMLWGVWGCHRISPPPQKVRTFKHHHTLHEVVSVLRQRFQQVHTIEATISLAYRSPQRSASCDAIFLAAFPGKLRIRGFAPLMPLLFDLLVTSRQIYLYLPREGKVLTGKQAASGELLAARQLMQLMNTLRQGKGTIRELYQDNHVLVMGLLAQERLRAVMSVAGEDLLLTYQALYGPQGRKAGVHYGDYRQLGQLWWPHYMRIELSRNQQMRLVFQQVRLNVPLAPQAFDFKPPADVRINP